MSDVSLNLTTGDIDIVNGDLALTTGRAATRQRLQQVLNTFQGEWFLDLSAGIPYYQSVLVKNPNPVIVDGILKDAVLKTPGVLSLTAFQLIYNANLRQLSVNFSVRTSDGDIDFTQILGSDLGGS